MGTEGICAAVVGADNLQQLEFNVGVARRFAPLSAAERDELLATAGEIYRRRAAEAWFICS